MAKVRAVSTYHGTTGKLIYLNLRSSQDRPLGYYDPDFQPVTRFSDAAIIVIQGALASAAPNAYQRAFEAFLLDIAGQEDANS